MVPPIRKEIKMKRYVEDIGYVEITLATFSTLPNNAIYFYSDGDYNYYICGDSDAIYAVMCKKVTDN